MEKKKAFVGILDRACFETPFLYVVRSIGSLLFLVVSAPVVVLLSSAVPNGHDDCCTHRPCPWRRRRYDIDVFYWLRTTRIQEFARSLTHCKNHFRFFSGACNVIVGHPLDLVKVRQQCRPAATTPSAVTTSAATLVASSPVANSTTSSMLRSILHTEGVVGLYAGVSAPLLAVVPAFGTFTVCSSDSSGLMALRD